MKRLESQAVPATTVNPGVIIQRPAQKSVSFVKSDDVLAGNNGQAIGVVNPEEIQLDDEEDDDNEESEPEKRMFLLFRHDVRC